MEAPLLFHGVTLWRKLKKSPLAGASEDDDKISPVVALATVDIANTELGVIWAENVGGVGPTIHPPIESTYRIGGDHVILADPRP